MPSKDPPGFRLRALDHIVLRVPDVGACVEFYQNVLGCSIEQAHPQIGLYQLRAGDFVIDILSTDGPIGRTGGPPPGPNGHNVDHFCVRIEPFDEPEIRRHLRDHGLDAGPLLNNWGGDGRGPSLYVTDPAGNTVELKGPPTHPYDPDVGFRPATITELQRPIDD